MGAMTLGERDGAPFFHCHALWTEADGRVNGGHILPEETIVAEPFEVDAFGIDGAVFLAEPDPETNFKLFGPVARAAAAAEDTLPRLRAAAAAEPGFCRLPGSVSAGSAASAARGFTAASAAPSARASPTAAAWCRSRPSLRSAQATIAPGADGALEAQLDVALVDYLGGLAEGRLVRGDNPVLMTMELVLEPLERPVGVRRHQPRRQILAQWQRGEITSVVDGPR